MPTHVECVKCGALVEGTIELVGPGKAEEARLSWEVVCDKCEAEFNGPMVETKQTQEERDAIHKSL